MGECFRADCRYYTSSGCTKELKPNQELAGTSNWTPLECPTCFATAP